MKRKFWILLGIIFWLGITIPNSLFAYDHLLNCVWWEESCNENFYKKFIDFFEEFQDRYDLSDGEVKSLFSDDQIQEIVKALEKKDAKKAEVFHIFDLINDIHSLNNWKFNALTEHDNYDKILSYIEDIEDSVDNLVDFKAYNYEARNCKIYRITYLPNQKAYVSPDFKKTEYFVSSKHLERYIETKNPGTCKIIQNFTLNTTFDNQGSIRFVAPNGKIYFLKQLGKQRYTEEMENMNYYDSLNMLKSYLRVNNPQIRL